MTIIDKLREINAKPHLGPTELAEIGSALPTLLRVAEAAKEYRAAQRGDYPGEYCAARKAELDAALTALGVGNG